MHTHPDRAPTNAMAPAPAHGAAPATPPLGAAVAKAYGCIVLLQLAVAPLQQAVQRAGYLAPAHAASAHTLDGALLLSALLLAPVFETLLLAAGLRLLARWLRRRSLLCLGSGVLWGVLHYPADPARVLPAMVGFTVYAGLYLALRPLGLWHALRGCAAAHALVNASALAALALGQWLRP